MDIKEKIKENVWCTNTEELFNTILKAIKQNDHTWSWHRSDGFRCKYINIRIDMRDGGFILLNDNNERISVEELWKQGLGKVY